MQSVSHVCYTAWREVLDMCKTTSLASSMCDWNKLGSGVIRLIPLDGKSLGFVQHTVATQPQVSCRQQALCRVYKQLGNYQYIKTWSSTVSVIWQIVTSFLESLFDFTGWKCRTSLRLKVVQPFGFTFSVVLPFFCLFFHFILSYRMWFALWFLFFVVVRMAVQKKKRLGQNEVRV